MSNQQSPLEQKLGFILNGIHESQTEQEAYDKVKSYFKSEGRIFIPVKELSYLCSLEEKERKLLTFPVMGDYFVRELNASEIKKEEMFYEVIWLISEMKFNNRHMCNLYQEDELFAQKQDELNIKIEKDPTQARKLYDLLQRIKTKVTENNPQNTVLVTRKDIGHGIWSTATEISSVINYVHFVEDKEKEKLDLVIMVVDDTCPEKWYQRMLAAGFQQKGNQKGYFSDAESALEALKFGEYDIILSDLELEEGMMQGIEFVDEAYVIMKNKNENPLISVFSYSNEMLSKANEVLADRLFYDVYPKYPEEGIPNNKSFFMPTEFKRKVINHLTNFESDIFF